MEFREIYNQLDLMQQHVYQFESVMKRPKPVVSFFSVPCRTSSILKEFVKSDEISRIDATSKIMSHVHKHHLLEEDLIRADEALIPIVGESCSLYGLQMKLDSHLFA
jgi:hypothetical protein